MQRVNLKKTVYSVLEYTCPLLFIENTMALQTRMPEAALLSKSLAQNLVHFRVPTD